MLRFNIGQIRYRIPDTGLAACTALIDIHSWVSVGGEGYPHSGPSIEDIITKVHQAVSLLGENEPTNEGNEYENP